MKIALIDANRADRRNLRDIIVSGFREAGIAITELQEFDTGGSFVQHFSLSNRFDLVILDVMMADSSGIQIAEDIHAADPQIRIVFCTASNNFASEAYHVNASYYILKPVDTEKIRDMIERLDLSDLVRNRYIFLPDGQKLSSATVIYAECINHTLSFYLTTGSIFHTRLQYEKLDEMLRPFPQFFSCARGIILNFDHVLERNNDTFIMSNGASLPISRRKKRDAIAAYNDYCFEKPRKIPPPSRRSPERLDFSGLEAILGH